MNSHGLEIKINGEYFCRAGFDTHMHVLACALDLAKTPGQTDDRIELSVGGMEGEAIKQIYWAIQQALRRGDQITIEVVSGPFDPPLSQSDLPQPPQGIDFENTSIQDMLDQGATLFGN